MEVNFFGVCRTGFVGVNDFLKSKYIFDRTMLDFRKLPTLKTSEGHFWKAPRKVGGGSRKKENEQVE